MRRTLKLAAILTLAPAAGCATSPGPAPDAGTPRAAEPASIDAVIERITTAPPLDGAHWGIAVYDPVNDRWIYRRNEGDLFVPASNTKLLAATTAMATLGPDWRYHTPILAYGAPPGDTIATALLVEARGDPTMSDDFLDGDLAALDSLADSIAADVRRVEGPVIIDARYFEPPMLHSSWEIGYIEWSERVAPFVVAEAQFEMRIAPGATQGEPAEIEEVFTPVGIAEIENRVVTVPAGADGDVDAVYPTAAVIGLPMRELLPLQRVIMTGTIPVGSEPDTTDAVQANPTAYAARALVAALEDEGVEVEGGVRIIYGDSGAAELPDGPDRLVATWTSPPLIRIVKAILEPSNNWLAEQLLKTLGAELGDEGSWDGGREVERAFLFGVAGVDSAGINLDDSSGLSRHNLISPAAAIQLFRYVRQTPWAAAYRDALAGPGEEDSTLEDRLLALEGRVAAKTGTLDHVIALSGYVTTDTGEPRIFSIFANATGQPSDLVRAAVDSIVLAIAGMRRTPTAEDAARPDRESP